MGVAFMDLRGFFGFFCLKYLELVAEEAQADHGEDFLLVHRAHVGCCHLDVVAEPLDDTLAEVNYHFDDVLALDLGVAHVHCAAVGHVPARVERDEVLVIEGAALQVVPALAVANPEQQPVVFDDVDLEAQFADSPRQSAARHFVVVLHVFEVLERALVEPMQLVASPLQAHLGQELVILHLNLQLEHACDATHVCPHLGEVVLSYLLLDGLDLPLDLGSDGLQF